MNISKFKISNFNSVVIFFVIFIFGLLFFYSFPNIHNKYDIQKHFTNEIDKKFPLKLSLSPDITYSILPKPHFKVKNVKIFFNSENENIEFGEAKIAKLFFSNVGSVNFNNLNLNKIIIQDCDLRIYSENYKYIKNLINYKNNKVLKFEKTRLYIKKKKDIETIINFILIDQINLSHDLENDNNLLKVNGKLFNQKTEFLWSKKLSDNQQIFNLKIKSLKLDLETVIKNFENYFSSTKLRLNRAEFLSNSIYDNKEKSVTFKSQKSKIGNTQIDYDLKVLLEPFYFIFTFNLERLNFKQFVSNPVILEQIIKNLIFGNEALNGELNLRINKVSGSKIFDKIDIISNIRNKKYTLKDSAFHLKDEIGELKIMSSDLNLINNELVFVSQLKANIKNQANFYRLFLVPKNNRKKLESLDFYLEYNLTNKKISISDVRLNNSENLYYEEQSQNLVNWVYFKKYVNKVFSVQEG